jgi:hypothetical protein
MPAPAWLPEGAELVVLLNARSVGTQGAASANSNNFGRVTGVLSDGTTITADQARASMEMVCAEAVEIVGLDDLIAYPETGIAPRLVGLAVNATMYRAAADLEASFFPRQTTRDQTANAYWDKRADATLKRLEAAAASQAAEDEPGPADNAPSGVISAFYPPSRLRYADGTRRVF